MPPRSELERQVGNLKSVAGGENHGPLDNVLELTDVAGP
jgi:hypothetical protein